MIKLNARYNKYINNLIEKKKTKMCNNFFVNLIIICTLTQILLLFCTTILFACNLNKKKKTNS